MKINIFSGARRLGAVFAALAALTALGFTAFSEPYISLNYTVSAPGAPFVHAKEDCPDKAAIHYITALTPEGKSVSVSLCLLPMAFGKDGTELIPYRVDSEGMIWGAEEYSSEVFAYEKELESRFRLSPADVELAKSARSKKYWQQWRDTLLYLAVGLAAYWLVITAVGWIVRGFLGVPFGKDSRASEVVPGDP